MGAMALAVACAGAHSGPPLPPPAAIAAEAYAA